MKNKLHEILNLIDRMDNIDVNPENGDAVQYDNNNDDVNRKSYTKTHGELRSRIKKDIEKPKYDKYTGRKNLDDIVSGDDNDILFTDAIYRIGFYIYSKSKEKITQPMIEWAFTKYIKNRKIFCPQIDIPRFKAEVMSRNYMNSEKNNELSIEFNDDEVTSNFKNVSPPLDFVEHYAKIYNKIKNNKGGRLGQFFELLFGKAPDRSPESDFGKGEEGVEVKTKHLDSLNGIIALTKYGIDTAENLFNESKVSDNDRIKRGIANVLNERLMHLSNTLNYRTDGMCVIVRNAEMATNSAKTKRFVIQQDKNLYNMEARDENGNVEYKPIMVIEKEQVANIFIESLKTLDEEETVLATYRVFVEGKIVKEKNGPKEDIYVTVEVTLEDPDDFRFNRIISCKFLLTSVIKKIGEKAPTLFVAFGEDAEYNVPGWDYTSDVYVYTKASIFKYTGIETDDNVIELIKRGLLKIDLSIPTGKYKNVDTINAVCSLSMNYDKVLRDSKTLFPVLFTYEKSI